MLKAAIGMAVLGSAVLFGLSAPTRLWAEDVDDYRWTPDQSSVCRVVEIHTTNRWGTDVTIRRRVCDQ